MRVKRLRIALVDAVRGRMTVAYLIVWLYCRVLSSRRISQVSTGVSCG